MSSVERARFRIKKLYADLVRGRDRLVITPATDTPSSERPIFVFGLYRSGTTLVRYILDAHSQIACPPESDFLAHLDALMQDDRSMQGLNDLGFDRNHVTTRLKSFADYFFANYAAAKGKPRWADKTPRYVDHMPFIYSLFPSAQFVMVYRHPLDQIHSFTRGGTYVPWHLVSLHTDGRDPRVSAAEYWVEKTNLMLAFQAAHASQCFTISYEQLATNPVSTGSDLFRFLDVPWEPNVLELQNHRHDRGMEDSKIVATTRIKLATGGYETWPQKIVESVLDITRPTRYLLGYDEAPATNPTDA